MFSSEEIKWETGGMPSTDSKNAAFSYLVLFQL